VHFDNEALLLTCIRWLAEAPPIAKTRLQWRKAGVSIERSGVGTKETATSAAVTLDDKVFTKKAGENIVIEKGQKHRLSNEGTEPVWVIEVQTGEYFGEDDIKRYEDDYKRA
jgi:hypothetical protein